MAEVLIAGRDALGILDSFLSAKRASKKTRPVGDLFEGARMVDVRIGHGSDRKIRRPVWVSETDDGIKVESCDAVTKALRRHAEKKTGLTKIATTSK